MILPSKHISEGQALVGVGAALLIELQRPHTVTSLWEAVRALPSIGTFERYVLALDLLYLMDAIELDGGMIQRRAQ